MTANQPLRMAPFILGGFLSLLSSSAFAQAAPAPSDPAPTPPPAAPKKAPADTAASKRTNPPAHAPAAAAAPDPRPEPSAPLPSATQEATNPAASMPPLAAEERAALIAGLMQERLYWRSRDTVLTAPVLATLAGVVGSAVGVGLVVGGNNDGHNHGMINAGIGVSITGVVSFITGLALFCYRTSSATQSEEILRIDRKLDSLGIPARITPWMTPGAQASAGLTLKMQL